MSKSIQLLVAAGVGAIAIGSAIYLLKRETNLENKKMRHSKMTTLRVKIPLEKSSIVMGMQGETIQEIRWKSKARIDFETDPIDGARIAVIRGSQEETQLAEVLIYQILSFESDSDYLEVSIPNGSVEHVLGVNNQNLDRIKKATNCDVSLMKQKSNFKAQNLVLRGKSNEISAAQAFILEKIQETKIEKVEQSTKVPTLFLTVEGYGDGRPEETSSFMRTIPKVEPLKATSGDGLIEILLSSICDPFEFYVQIVGVSSVQLDKLVEDMTMFYEQDINRRPLDPNQINSGDLVAARFSADGRWYRASVVRVTVDDYDDTKVDVDVDFVDFGDFQVKSLTDVAILHPQFLKLNFQAIKCAIANIRPANSRNWSDQAIDDFERLTHAGSWKSLLARVVHHRLETSNHQTISVPCLDIIDASCETDINIATELVRLGHAVFSDSSNSSSTLQTPVLDNSNLFEDSLLETSVNGTNHES